jgi:hypothetical protein
MATWKYVQPVTRRKDAVTTSCSWSHSKTREVIACGGSLEKRGCDNLVQSEENLTTEEGRFFPLQEQNQDTTENFLELED